MPAFSLNRRQEGAAAREQLPQQPPSDDVAAVNEFADTLEALRSKLLEACPLSDRLRVLQKQLVGVPQDTSLTFPSCWSPSIPEGRHATTLSMWLEQIDRYLTRVRADRDAGSVR